MANPFAELEKKENPFAQFEKPPGSAIEQLGTGATKRVGEMVEGLRGFGLRAGETLGIVSPERLAEYERLQQQSRSVFSPQYRQFAAETPLEFVGGMGVDLAALYGVGAPLRVGGAALGGKTGEALSYTGQALSTPRTVPQAALGGGIYAQTVPYGTTPEALQGTTISAGTAGAVQPVLRAIGLGQTKPSDLTEQQKESARRAVEAGFQFTPAQMTGSTFGQFIDEGVKSFPLARGGYAKLEKANQQTLQRAAADAIGLQKDVPFTTEAFRDAFTYALNKYQGLSTIPSIKLDKGFVQEIDRLQKTISKTPEFQRDASIQDAIKTLDGYKELAKKATDGATLFQGLKAMNGQLFSAQTSGSPASAVFKDLRSQLEQAIERQITAPSKKNIVDPKVIKDFQEGRTRLSNWYTVNEAFDEATGAISGQKLATSLARKSNFGSQNTELETAAMAARAFPKFLPSSGTAERTQAANVLTGIFGGTGALLSGSPNVQEQLLTGAISAAVPQALAGLYGRAATSEPVRSIVARRQLGAIAPDEGILAGAARRFETGVPGGLRFGLGDIARLYAEREQLQGLLGE
jgi:hypothetical protein